jgi:glyceraldehyde 3-phosphate dehydrogenase
MPTRIAINGFGRIGRQLARIMHGDGGADLKLVAVNTLETAQACAYLLQHDTFYGGMGARIQAEGDTLLINDQVVRFFRNAVPGEIPWGDLGVDVVIDSSGASAAGLQAHLRQGAPRVIATGHIPGADIIICMGVNQERFDPRQHRIVCAGSCTTSCIAPAAKVLAARFGLEHLFATVIHSFTSGQNLHDGGHADLRRARAATANIIPTTTSATEQLALVLPQLAGKFTGMAMRVPTPVVHAADLVARVRKRGTRQELLAAFEEAAAGEMQGILTVSHLPLVSSDLKGSPFSCVVDGELTGFHDDMIKAVLWHDNEYCYSSRVLDLVRLIALR